MYLGDDNILYCEGATARRNVNPKEILLIRDNDSAVSFKIADEGDFLDAVSKEYSATTLLLN